MEDQQPRVGLTDAVQAVRGELRAAMVAGSEEVRSAFALGSVELEFAIDFHPAADGRVQVLVLSADTDESEQPVRIHRLRMTLDKGLLPRPGYGAPLGSPGVASRTFYASIASSWQDALGCPPSAVPRHQPQY